MEMSAANIEEMAEALSEIHDLQRQSRNFRHRLIDILVITLVAMIVGKTNTRRWRHMERRREEFFRTFLELPNGIPGEWTFERIFRWVDGEKHAVHEVSACPVVQNLVLWQLATDAKSNEITAIPPSLH